MSKRALYSNNVFKFLREDTKAIIGTLASAHSQELTREQIDAWEQQINILKTTLKTTNSKKSHIYFEFVIPRMGKRVDTILIHEGIIFVLEFKIYAKKYDAQDIRQAQGYALDLKNFHLGSHKRIIIPILVSTEAINKSIELQLSKDKVGNALLSNPTNLWKTINQITKQFEEPNFNAKSWEMAPYQPTPTIVEAAQALYANHHVSDISRSEASNKNIESTSKTILETIHKARVNKEKIICFVTGVPGAGKTLVGLNIASTHSRPDDSEYSVFLSGNAPLVSVLTEALARDKSKRENKPKYHAQREVKQFIQGIHNFRDEYLDPKRKPSEGVLIYDEAQRAWTKKQAKSFMREKRGVTDFNESEPEFLMNVMDRRKDWAVIIALIGGGQEINTGEAGLSGWIEALNQNFNHWKAFCSDELLRGDYVSDQISEKEIARIQKQKDLHLTTSMRSFRAENLSALVHYIIDNDRKKARSIYSKISNDYPIAITRDIESAREWIKKKRRGNESSGLIASSNGMRLKPHGIFVKNKVDPIYNWFLNPHEDVRSSHALEDCATEFEVQGLELDWCIVAWDADYRFNGKRFEHWRFSGTQWQQRRKEEGRKYLANAYRVLLTRARQGMVIFIPKGDSSDPTRPPEFYDQLHTYLIDCGLPTI